MGFLDPVNTMAESHREDPKDGVDELFRTEQGAIELNQSKLCRCQRP